MSQDEFQELLRDKPAMTDVIRDAHGLVLLGLREDTDTLVELLDRYDLGPRETLLVLELLRLVEFAGSRDEGFVEEIRNLALVRAGTGTGNQRQLVVTPFSELPRESPPACPTCGEASTWWSHSQMAWVCHPNQHVFGRDERRYRKVNREFAP